MIELIRSLCEVDALQIEKEKTNVPHCHSRFFVFRIDIDNSGIGDIIITITVSLN